MVDGLRVRRQHGLDERDIGALSELLMDCVAAGASVGFMAPLARTSAETFWLDVAASAVRGERMVLIAEDVTAEVLGTVQVIWAQPENQPHRGDIAKMLVHSGARRQGIGAALLAHAEHCARKAGRTLLVLDTANEVAERLYVRAGWQRVGVIPRYALWPRGGWCATTVLFKDLSAAGAP
jgi:GNAT superfamily N-acetyltransferase